MAIDCDHLASMGPLISQRNNQRDEAVQAPIAKASMGPLISQRNNLIDGTNRQRASLASMGPLISQRNNAACDHRAVAVVFGFNGAADFSAEQHTARSRSCERSSRCNGAADFSAEQPDCWIENVAAMPSALQWGR